MPSKSSARWPVSPADKQDHYHVIDLVQRVGWSRLRFTARDLRAAMGTHGAPTLRRPNLLGRHLALLPESIVCRVDQRFAAVAASPVGATTGEGAAEEAVSGAAQPAPGSATAAVRASTKTLHYYVLAERLEEHLATPREPDEYERVYYAVWVAVRALDVVTVPTNVVTRVLDAVPGLGVRKNYQTSLFLAALRDRTVPLVQMEKPESGSRWVSWRPLGSEPQHPHMSTWVEEARRALGAPATGRGDAHGVGYSTLGEVARELVLRALERSKSPDWPARRSVTVDEIEATAQSNATSKALLALIRDRGGSLAQVLGDATKTQVAGTRRVHQRIVKLPGPIGSQAYYDVPDLPGLERRRLIVDYQTLRATVTSERLRGIEQESLDAERLLRACETSGQSSVLAVTRTIALSRLALVHAELDELDGVVASLEAKRSLLSKAKRTDLETAAARVAAVRGRAGCARTATQAADEALARYALSVSDLRGTPRPLLRADEYAAWLPAARREDRSSPELLANARALRRFPNPDHVHRKERDARRSAILCVDRVDALLYLAGRTGGRALPFLQDGARLLGHTMRDARLLRALLDASADESGVSGTGTGSRFRQRSWESALAALVLLGDSAAADTAVVCLHDEAAPAERVIAALQVLLVLRRLEPARLPTWLRWTTDARLRPMVLSLEGAVRHERWFLQ